MLLYNKNFSCIKNRSYVRKLPLNQYLSLQNNKTTKLYKKKHICRNDLILHIGFILSGFLLNYLKNLIVWFEGRQKKKEKHVASFHHLKKIIKINKIHRSNKNNRKTTTWCIKYNSLKFLFYLITYILLHRKMPIKIIFLYICSVVVLFKNKNKKVNRIKFYRISESMT